MKSAVLLDCRLGGSDGVVVMAAKTGPLLGVARRGHLAHLVAVTTTAPGQRRLGGKVFLRRAVTDHAFYPHQTVLALKPDRLLSRMAFGAFLAKGLLGMLFSERRLTQRGDGKPQHQTADKEHPASPSSRSRRFHTHLHEKWLTHSMASSFTDLRGTWGIRFVGKNTAKGYGKCSTGSLVWVKAILAGKTPRQIVAGFCLFIIFLHFSNTIVR